MPHTAQDPCAVFSYRSIDQPMESTERAEAFMGAAILSSRLRVNSGLAGGTSPGETTQNPEFLSVDADSRNSQRTIIYDYYESHRGLTVT